MRKLILPILAAAALPLTLIVGAEAGAQASEELATAQGLNPDQRKLLFEWAEHLESSWSDDEREARLKRIRAVATTDSDGQGRVQRLRNRDRELSQQDPERYERARLLYSLLSRLSAADARELRALSVEDRRREVGRRVLQSAMVALGNIYLGGDDFQRLVRQPKDADSEHERKKIQIDRVRALRKLHEAREQRVSELIGITADAALRERLVADWVGLDQPARNELLRDLGVLELVLMNHLNLLHSFGRPVGERTRPQREDALDFREKVMGAHIAFRLTNGEAGSNGYVRGKWRAFQSNGIGKHAKGEPGREQPLDGRPERRPEGREEGRPFPNGERPQRGDRPEGPRGRRGEGGAGMPPPPGPGDEEMPRRGR